MTTTSTTCLDLIESHFQVLSRNPVNASIDGRALQPGLPQRIIGVIELRSILLHPSTTYETRDAVLRLVVARAAKDQTWQTVLLGLLLPGLRRASRQLVSSVSSVASSDVRADIDTELIAGVLEGLRSGAGETKIASGLLTNALRRARAIIRQEQRAARLREGVAPLIQDEDDSLDVLEQLIADGVLTSEDVSLVAMTRLDGWTVHELAVALETSPDTLRHRRRRIEARIARHYARDFS